MLSAADVTLSEPTVRATPVPPRVLFSVACAATEKPWVSWMVPAWLVNLMVTLAAVSVGFQIKMQLVPLAALPRRACAKYTSVAAERLLIEIVKRIKSRETFNHLRATFFLDIWNCLQ